MSIEIIVPRLGWSMEEGAFVAWLKKDREFVRAGEPLFSIEGDKAVQEIEAIDSGVLHIPPDAPKPNSPVRVGDLLGYLLSEGETLADTGTTNKQAAPYGSPPGAKTESTSSIQNAPPKCDSLTTPVTGSLAATVAPPVSSGQVPAISPRALRTA